jgi:endonuclease/exonuclease/phosphatase family metal-dependent hydrolase
MPIRICSVFIMLCVFVVYNGNSQTSLMSFNIRYDNKNDMENSWDNRKAELAVMIASYHPDILGIQEGLYHQVEYLSKILPEYNWIGAGRDDGSISGEFSAIFYKTEKWENLSKQTFWLSETPDSVSKGWDAALNRIATAGLFINKKTKDTLFVINSHFDHIGKVARQKSAELILHKIKKMGWGHFKGVVMGDFNSQPFEEPILIFSKSLDDAVTTSKSPFLGSAATFNEFNTKKLPEMRIDYIFTQRLSVLSCRHIDDRRKNNLFFSDHFPVFVILKSD